MRPFNSLENKIPSDVLKSSASMYENQGSQFFRTTTWIESVPDALGKPSLVMTLLINLGVTEILYSFTLVLEGNTGKGVIKVRVPRKVFS